MKRITTVLLAGTAALFMTACGGSSSGDDSSVAPDTTPPVITIIGKNPDTAILNYPYNDPGATATDDRDGSVNVTASGTVDTSMLGEYEIRYQAVDSSGNAASASRIVNVVSEPDTQPPVITLHGDNPMHLLQNDVYNEPGASAIDNVDGNVEVIISGDVDTSIPGTYIVSYTAEDTSENKAIAQRTVNVEPVATHYVSDTPELRQALLDAAQNGLDDRIILADGIYKTTDDGEGTFTFSSTEDKYLSIEGMSNTNTILSGDNKDRSVI